MTTAKRKRRCGNESPTLDRDLARWDLEAAPPTDRGGLIAARGLGRQRSSGLRILISRTLNELHCQQQRAART